MVTCCLAAERPSWRSGSMVQAQTLVGEPLPIVDGLYTSGAGPTSFSASETGILAYVPGGSALTNRRLTWLDMSGRRTGVMGELGEHGDVRFSPDGRRTALTIVGPTKQRDIWIFDNDRGIRTRFTADDGDEMSPVWSPDGSRVAYASRRDGRVGLYVKSAGGVGDAEVVVADDRDKHLEDWSPDGRSLLFRTSRPGGGADLMILPMTGDGNPAPYLATSFNETLAQFSPDGKWVVYVSDESGSREVYVAPFPNPSSRWRISTDGGFFPRWSRDGRTIVYSTLQQQFAAADVSISADQIRVERVRELFDAVGVSGTGYAWDMTPEGSASC